MAECVASGAVPIGRLPPLAGAAAKRQKTCDLDLRLTVTAALLSAGIPRDAIRHEITLDSASSDGRADMVVALDRALVGIELKSGKDTLDRLESQRERYSARFDRLVLVADVRHVPEERGVKRLSFPCVRLFGEGRLMGQYEGPWHNVSSWDNAPWDPNGLIGRRSFGAGDRQSPNAMLSMLWADEALAVAADLVQAGLIPPTGGHQRYRVIPHTAEHASIGQLRPRIAAALRGRQMNRWEEAFWSRFDAQEKP